MDFQKRPPVIFPFIYFRFVCRPLPHLMRSREFSEVIPFFLPSSSGLGVCNTATPSHTFPSNVGLLDTPSFTNLEALPALLVLHISCCSYPIALSEPRGLFFLPLFYCVLPPCPFTLANTDMNLRFSVI